MACPRAPAVLMIANGVLIDKYMQAMDTNYDVIHRPVLPAGNCCGQYFGVDYTLNIGGVSMGHAVQELATVPVSRPAGCLSNPVARPDGLSSRVPVRRVLEFRRISD